MIYLKNLLMLSTCNSLIGCSHKTSHEVYKMIQKDKLSKVFKVKVRTSESKAFTGRGLQKFNKKARVVKPY